MIKNEYSPNDYSLHLGTPQIITVLNEFLGIRKDRYFCPKHCTNAIFAAEKWLSGVFMSIVDPIFEIL